VGTHNRTELARVDPKDPDPGLIGRAADYIRRGFLVAFPTETVYGLGGNALSEAAVDRIFVAKGRDRSDPLIVHLADAGELQRVATGIPPEAFPLVDAFWPGPLTLVLQRAEGVAPAVSAGRTTVAVRVPSHPVAHMVIATAGVPVAAPSANRFMRTSATTAAHVLDDLDGRVELILDGGPATIGMESTVLDATTPVLRLLRPGAIPLEDLRRVAGRDVEVAPTAGGPSPGMLARHYAPSTRLRLVEGDGDALADAVQVELEQGRRVGVLCTDFEAAMFHPTVRTEALGAEVDDVARELYAAIRRLDDGSVDVIMVRDYGDAGLGRAIRDRLRRAATPLEAP
jgi:L-threonylcarbamoyladenylate synthase